jgi:ZIP family zinc transporter
VTQEPVLAALVLTLLAGLSTAIGSLIALFARRTDTRLLAVAMGFSAGVMLYVSFVELLPSGSESLAEVLGAQDAANAAVAALFGGILAVALIDRLVPMDANPHEIHRMNAGAPPESADLHRAGVLTAAAIAVHNFPEGLATFMSALDDLRVGVSVAVAIAIHNIPEGIAVAMPVFYATGSRGKAFLWSALSGLSEPLGAVLGLAVLAGVWSDLLLGLSLAGVAGMMIFISFDVLLPSAEAYGEHHAATYALIVGMGVMALSLLLLD